MTSGLSSRRIKPTLETKFHIDYEWWERSDQELRANMIGQLNPEQREYFLTHTEGEPSDWVDPDTAEVRQVDALQMALQEASNDPEYFTSTSLVNGVFRVFLTNNNVPLTPVELAEKIGRPSKTILRTLSGNQVYKGVRPYLP